MKNKKYLYLSISMLVLFVIWTVMLCFVDREAIGPQESAVGFAAFNGFVHDLTGHNMWLYDVTDWFGLAPFAVCIVFAIFGVVQLIRRKSLSKVDYSIKALGCFYIAVIAAYVLFEFVVINYRPVLIEGKLEASYPSSTTLLMLCVMPTAIMQLNSRIKGKKLRLSINIVLVCFTAFMVIGRLVSGVHWVSDIIGGALLSAGLVLMYQHFVSSRKIKA